MIKTDRVIVRVRYRRVVGLLWVLFGAAGLVAASLLELGTAGSLSWLLLSLFGALMLFRPYLEYEPELPRLAVYTFFGLLRKDCYYDKYEIRKGQLWGLEKEKAAKVYVYRLLADPQDWKLLEASLESSSKKGDKP